MTANRQVLLAETPKAKLTPGHFQMRETPVPSPADGELLVRTLLISVDAANRAWMQGATYRSAAESGAVMPAYALTRIVESKAPGFAAGDFVFCDAGWQDYAVIPAREAEKAPDHQPRSHLMSVLGIAGKTAYHGLFSVGGLKSDDTVLVSAAAGSVGSIVGQIAKIQGCRVVGIAGGPEKCRWITEDLGFDAAIDYKSEPMGKALRKHCPDGVDLYFDNVGGAVLEAALFAMAMRGRIVCCGAVSQYDTDQMTAPRGVPGLMVVKRLRMEGFIVMDYAHEDARAEADLKQWVAAGRLKVVEDIVDGLENAPQALIGLLAGENRGKRMIRVADA